MSTLERMPNIGPAVAAQLRQAGIETPEQLRRVGSRQAWLRIQAFDKSACINRLCGLEGAIQDIRWHSLAPEVKQELKAFYAQHRVSRT